jgi:diguanylate cyclase (GGDEF)-like protein
MREARPRRPGLPASVAWLYLGFCVLMAVGLVALRGSALVAAPFALTGVGTTVAVLVGRRLNRPAVTLPWTVCAVACTAFIVGAVLRQVLAGQPLAPLADAATLTGYAGTLTAFIALTLNRKGAGRALHELVDGLIVLAATGSAALVFFTLPTAHVMGLTPFAVLQGAYPVIDVALAFVTLLLSFTSANRAASFWLLALTVLGILVGDIGYAHIGTQGHTIGSPLLDLPFVLAFGCFGAAALHPSMVSLSAIQTRPVQAWSGGRLALLVPALLLPPAVVIVGNTTEAAWIGGTGAALVAVLLLLRALGAVHEHAESQHGLRYQATHDALTGLANRAALVTRVEDMLRVTEREDCRVDLLFLDIDSFKLVNDTWGHQVGDRVLRIAAQRLQAVAGPSDVLARIGGDEFVVARLVAPTMSRSGEDLAASIMESFHVPLPDLEGALVATVSIGLVRSQHPATAEGLLRDADTAMYRAKGVGKNRCVVFDSSMHDAVRQRVETELALRTALFRNELLLHYQPIVSLHDSEVRGVEALLRWAHPRFGMVSPLGFIPVAEETGLIVEIGEWVVSEAVRQLSSWRASGARDLWVSVNVSARQLRDSSLVGHVERELRRHNVPADCLLIEITESAMMADEDASAEVLERLRRLGVSLAVDDFGTGYSSLGHLRRFPVSKVKIDRGFVSRVDVDSGDAAIVRAVVAMSHAMGLEVVAEGIETESQRALLERSGVSLGQGWLFGRPLAAEDCGFVDRESDQALRAKSYPM